MPITLVTGANRGLGRETARRLVESGHTVFLGARSRQRGGAAAREIGAHFVEIDVTDDRSVDSAMQMILERQGGLDVLINNAGIPDNTTEVATIRGDVAREVFDTNVVGVVRVTQAALPMLLAAERGIIVNVSSGLGSFWANTEPDRPEARTPLVVYAASKAAVAMLTLKYARELPTLRVNAACPGLTATDFSAGFPGARPVEQSVEVILRLATLPADGPTGTAQESTGPLPW